MSRVSDTQTIGGTRMCNLQKLPKGFTHRERKVFIVQLHNARIETVPAALTKFSYYISKMGVI